MFKLNEKGAVLSGVFYGILLLFLFLVLGSIIVLGNGRKALRQAKDNAINELNSKNILVDKVVLDSTNTSGGSYQTNNVDKNLLDINVSLSNSKATIVVTLYNNTSTPYTFSGIKYHNFTNSEKDTYPLLTFYNYNTDIVIDESSFSSVIDTVIAPNSTIEVPLEFIFNPNLTNPSKSIRSFIIFKVKENAISGSNIKTLSFDAGVPNLKVASQEYEVNSTLGVLPTITRDGYLLSGWYNGSTKLESTTKITDNMVATAKWVTLLANGTVVYYNPVTNAKCTASQAVSTTGTKTGCMKWYAFNDEGNDTVNLLLDHNTTAKVAWASSGTNANNDMYYFHTNSPTAYTGAAGTNKYAWLFDNTITCTTYGCNVADSSNYGYWTNTAHSSKSSDVWHARNGGNLNYYSVADPVTFGVRPVITVSRSIIS